MAPCTGRQKGGHALFRRAARTVAVFVACLPLLSCGGQSPLLLRDDPAPAAATAASRATPTTVLATPVPTPPIGEVVWAADVDAASGAPAHVVTRYSPDAPRITAATVATDLPVGSRVAASWAYNDTSLGAFDTELVTTDDVAQQWLLFHIARDPNVPWPAGAYEITISLDSTIVQRATVEVAADA